MTIVLSPRVNRNPLRKVRDTEYRKHGIGFTVACSLACGHTVWRGAKKVGKFARCPECGHAGEALDEKVRSNE